MITFAYENILNLQVDAIVNPAHTSLFAGSGLCGIIHRYAGRELETYCRTLGTQNYGDVVITPSFKLLNCKRVIHACGPRWIDGNQNEEATLEILYTRIIELVAQEEITSIAIRESDSNSTDDLLRSGWANPNGFNLCEQWI